MDVKPAATGRSINRDDPGRAGLAQKKPLLQPFDAHAAPCR